MSSFSDIETRIRPNPGFVLNNWAVICALNRLRTLHYPTVLLSAPYMKYKSISWYHLTSCPSFLNTSYVFFIVLTIST